MLRWRSRCPSIAQDVQKVQPDDLLVRLSILYISVDFADNHLTKRFVPGHSLDTFPDEMAMVRDAGHEIGLHGELIQSFSFEYLS